MNGDEIHDNKTLPMLNNAKAVASTMRLRKVLKNTKTSQAAPVQVIRYKDWGRSASSLPTQSGSEIQLSRILSLALLEKCGRFHKRKGTFLLVQSESLKSFLLDAYWFIFLSSLHGIEHERLLKLHNKIEGEKASGGKIKSLPPAQGLPPISGALLPPNPTPQHLSDTVSPLVTPRKPIIVETKSTAEKIECEKQILFGRMSLSYQAVFHGVPQGKKDMLLRDIPAILSIALKSLFIKTLPYARHLLGKGFHDAIFKVVTYWISGVEREAVHGEGNCNSAIPIGGRSCKKKIKQTDERKAIPKERRQSEDQKHPSPEDLKTQRTEGCTSKGASILQQIKLPATRHKLLGNTLGVASAFNNILDAQNDELRMELQGLRKQFNDITRTTTDSDRFHENDKIEETPEADSKQKLPSETIKPTPPKDPRIGKIRRRAEQAWYEKGRRASYVECQWTRGCFHLTTQSPLIKRFTHDRGILLTKPGPRMNWVLSG